EKGRPHVLLLTPGNTHDAKVAMLAIDAVPPSDYLVADKGYDSNALRSWLIERHHAGHPVKVQPQGPNRPRPPNLPAAQRRRAHVLPLQGLAPRRHPLRS